MTASPERLGRYVVIRLLGAGGFATVWLAFDEYLDMQVAIKVLADNWARNLDVRHRFLDEARIQRRAEDDRIVRVHEVGELQDGRPYFVMDFADRGSLDERIRTRQASGGFSLVEVAAYAREIAECLTVAERLGVVHRDLKPNNVLLRTPPAHRRNPGHPTPLGDEQVMLGDFGLAKEVAAASGLASILGGTPGYAAPEQLSGDRAVDARTDVFALATIVYELAAGRLPFTASIPPGDRHPAERVLLPPLAVARPDCPASLQAVLERGLAADPERRWSSARELGQAVVDAVSGSTAPLGMLGPRPSPEAPEAPFAPHGPPAVAGNAPTVIASATPSAQARPRRRRLVAAAAIGAVVLGGGLAGLGVGRSEQNTTKSRATTKMVYQDDFSAPLWTQLSTDKAVYGYVKGQYQMLIRDPNRAYDSSAPMPVPSGSVRNEVDATKVSGSGGTFGLGCRSRTSPDGTTTRYVGAFDVTGFWRIVKYQGASTAPLTLAEARFVSDFSRSIGPAANRVAVECRGGDQVGTPVQIRLFLNGQIMRDVTDPTGLGPGVASLEVGTESQPLEIHFDNLTVEGL